MLVISSQNRWLIFFNLPDYNSDGYVQRFMWYHCCYFCLKILQEAVKLKPSFADAHLNQGNVYKVSLMNYDSSLWPEKLSAVGYGANVLACPGYGNATGGNCLLSACFAGSP
jgi:hypothetical protein